MPQKTFTRLYCSRCSHPTDSQVTVQQKLCVVLLCLHGTVQVLRGRGYKSMRPILCSRWADNPEAWNILRRESVEIEGFFWFVFSLVFFWSKLGVILNHNSIISGYFWVGWKERPERQAEGTWSQSFTVLLINAAVILKAENLEVVLRRKRVKWEDFLLDL